MEKFDIYLWIKSIIDSCVTEAHLEGSNKLINRYYIHEYDYALYHSLHSIFIDKKHFIEKERLINLCK